LPTTSSLWKQAQADVETAPFLRRVRYVDDTTGKELVFLTNHVDLPASVIAAIYKERWQTELLFKALKQNLRIKTFVGTTANALKTQIWAALIALLAVKFLQLQSNFSWSLSRLIALLETAGCSSTATCGAGSNGPSNRLCRLLREIRRSCPLRGQHDPPESTNPVRVSAVLTIARG
jgi:hypothetical protein